MGSPLGLLLGGKRCVHGLALPSAGWRCGWGCWAHGVPRAFRDFARFLATLITVSPSLRMKDSPTAVLLSRSSGGSWAGSNFTLLCWTLCSTSFSPVGVLLALSSGQKLLPLCVRDIIAHCVERPASVF